MTVCSDLVTKEEFRELQNLVAQKIDKSEETRIVRASVDAAIPLSVAGAVATINPQIQGAINKAGQAFTTATKNAGKIATNVGKIAGNAANIIGILGNIASLAIVFKHEFIDLPGIRRQIKAQNLQIEFNFSLILQNKKASIDNRKKLGEQEKQITNNRAAIADNKATLAINQDTLNQNQKRLQINEQNIADNKLEINRIETEYQQRIDQLEKNFQSRIEASEAKLNAKIDKQVSAINKQVTRNQAISTTRFNQLDIILRGLTNNIAAVQNKTKTIEQTKVDKPELVTIRRRVATNTSTLNQIKTTTFTSGGVAASAETQKTVQTVNDKTKQIETEVKNLKDTSVNQQELNKFRTDLNRDFSNILAGAGLLGVSQTVNRIESKTLSRNQVVQATQTGICNSTNSGGCLNNNIKNPLSNKLDDILTAFNTTASGGNIALNTQILDRVKNIQSVVNSSTNGLAAINNFMRNAWSNSKLDKVLNVLNTVLALHNALMLSRNLGQTLGDVATSALQFLNIKDAEGQSIDVNSFIGSTVNTWITNLIGAETYANIQQTWTSLNRIMVAAQGVIFAVQGIKNAVLEGLEVVGGWTAKIGNNMMIQGLFEDRSYPWMNENVNFRNPFNKFIQRIETTEEVASQVNNLVSSGIEAQENFNELFDQVGEVGEGIEQAKTASQKLQESITQYDTDKEAIEQQENLNSASPDIDRLDLIQLEPDEI